MSKRNTYLIGTAAVIVGVILIVVAATTLSDENGDNSNTTPAGQQPPAGSVKRSGPPGNGGESSGNDAPGSGISRELAQGRRVHAPAVSLVVIGGGSPPPRVREPIHKATNGGKLAVGGLKGSPIVLHMWSSRCVPCRTDARLIEVTWKRWGPRGVVFAGLSVDEPREAALRFARQYDLSYPIASDPKGQVAHAYGVTGLPETFFISASGDIVGRVSGSPSVGQMEMGTAAAREGRSFGSEQGGSRVPLG
jgi:cytochrome c biogenesis protein CcmG/thiol:disulfide interchange protein DsbE